VAKRARNRPGKQAPPAVRAPRTRPGGGHRTGPRWSRQWLAIVLVVAAGTVGLALIQTHARMKPVAIPPLPLGSLAALGHLAAPGRPGGVGPETVPVPSAPDLATAGSLAPGQSVDGISCAPLEQLAFHIHAHLTVFVDGAPRRIPYGIGIAPPLQVESTPQGPFAGAGACFSWLHTHAADGIIHIESPSERVYTLGDFFDVWGQALGPTVVASARGHVTALVNGRPYEGNPRSIPLFSHAQIQLDVGRPLVAPESIRFPAGL
jgi:hypothetical protein